MPPRKIKLEPIKFSPNVAQEAAPPGLDSHARMKFDANGPDYEVTASDLELLRQLGRGQYGYVEEYRHLESGYVFAVKRIRCTDDPEERKRMLMDMQVNESNGGRCPYVVRSFGALFREGDIWICMEVMDASLEKFYKDLFTAKLTFPEEVLAHIAFAVVSGLKFLKDQLKVMHRDVKPSNILLSRRGEVKLCDFGVSGQLVQSMAKTNVGCSAYMPPERVNPLVVSEGYDIRSDVWSFGVTMIEVATGKHPYAKWKNAFQQMQQVVVGAAPSLPEGPFSDVFREFIDWCCQKDLEHRPKYERLLEHEFLRRDREHPTDISTFVKTVLDGNCIIDGAPQEAGA